MASPTIYKWTDTSAPIVFRGSSTDIQALFQACLIDGYGTKLPPVSGTNKWTIPFSDATSFILKQGGAATRKCGLKLYSPTTSGYMSMQAAVDWTDLNTSVTPWSAGTTSDRVAIGFSNSATRQIPWIIIATERALYAHFGYNITETIPTLYDSTFSTSMQNGHWFFGDYTPIDNSQTVNQLVTLSTTASATYTNYCRNFTSTISISGIGHKRISGNYANVDTPGGTAVNTMNLRNSAANALVIGADSTSEYIPTYPSPLDGSLNLDTLRIIANRTIMGSFPGLLYPIANEIYPASGFIPEIDGTGTFSGEKMLIFTDNNQGKYIIRDGEWGVD